MSGYQGTGWDEVEDVEEEFYVEEYSTEDGSGDSYSDSGSETGSSSGSSSGSGTDSESDSETDSDDDGKRHDQFDNEPRESPFGRPGNYEANYGVEPLPHDEDMETGRSQRGFQRKSYHSLTEDDDDDDDNGVISIILCCCCCLALAGLAVLLYTLLKDDDDGGGGSSDTIEPTPAPVVPQDDSPSAVPSPAPWGIPPHARPRFTPFPTSTPLPTATYFGPTAAPVPIFYTIPVSGDTYVIPEAELIGPFGDEETFLVRNAFGDQDAAVSLLALDLSSLPDPAELPGMKPSATLILSLESNTGNVPSTVVPYRYPDTFRDVETIGGDTFTTYDSATAGEGVIVSVGDAEVTLGITDLLFDANIEVRRHRRDLADGDPSPLVYLVLQSEDTTTQLEALAFHSSESGFPPRLVVEYNSPPTESPTVSVSPTTSTSPSVSPTISAKPSVSESPSHRPSLHPSMVPSQSQHPSMTPSVSGQPSISAKPTALWCNLCVNSTLIVEVELSLQFFGNTTCGELQTLSASSDSNLTPESCTSLVLDVKDTCCAIEVRR